MWLFLYLPVVTGKTNEKPVGIAEIRAEITTLALPNISNMLRSRLGDARLEFRPGYQVSCVISLFSQSRKIPGQYIDYATTASLQFVILPSDARSRNGSVDIVTVHGLQGRSSIPSRDKRFFFSTTSRLAPGPLSNGYGRFFPRG
jgi:hypothetical protein